MTFVTGWPARPSRAFPPALDRVRASIVCEVVADSQTNSPSQTGPGLVMRGPMTNERLSAGANLTMTFPLERMTKSKPENT
jgi:hypothetical protein